MCNCEEYDHENRIYTLEGTLVVIIDWLLNDIPLVNRDYTDILADKLSYILDKNYGRYYKE